MELFSISGHLTSDGLSALQDGVLDELGRLEATEHLSFCKECLLTYTAMPDGGLMAPEKPLAAPVLKAVRRRAGRLIWMRYGTVAAAACLAVLIWGVSGFLLPSFESAKFDAVPQIAAPAPAAPPARPLDTGGAVSQTIGGAFDGFHMFFSSILAPPPAGGEANPIAKAAQDIELLRREKEKVFEHGGTQGARE